MVVQFSIIPIGMGTSMSKEVSRALQLVDESGLKYRLTAMGTILEGEWDPIMGLIKKIHEHVLSRSERAYLTISIDDRKDKPIYMDSKTRAVESIIGKRLS